jgi:hypothetical protein
VECDRATSRSANAGLPHGSFDHRQRIIEPSIYGAEFNIVGQGARLDARSVIDGGDDIGFGKGNKIRKRENSEKGISSFTRIQTTPDIE